MTTATGTECRVETIETFEAWKEIAGAWNGLLQSSRSNTVFLTWEWLFSWAECFLQGERRLFIAVIYSGNELIGIAPWYLNRVGQNFGGVTQLEFLGSPEAGSDYLDIIIKAGREQEASGALYDFLFRDGPSPWDTLLFRDIPSDSLFFLHFHDRLEQEGKYAELCKGSYCPIVTFPKDREWTPGNSPKRKARFKQDLGRLKKSGEVSHLALRGTGATAGVDDFFRLYNEKSGRDGRHLHRFLKIFASRSEAQGLVQLDFLSIGGTTTAGLLHLVYGGEMLLFSMAVDKTFNPKISLGNVLVGLCLEQAAGQGRVRYDFLKGNERYKFYWADGARTSLGVFISRKKLRPLLFTATRFIKYTGKILLR